MPLIKCIHSPGAVRKYGAVVKGEVLYLRSAPNVEDTIEGFGLNSPHQRNVPIAYVSVGNGQKSANSLVRPSPRRKPALHMNHVALDEAIRQLISAVCEEFIKGERLLIRLRIYRLIGGTTPQLGGVRYRSYMERCGRHRTLRMVTQGTVRNVTGRQSYGFCGCSNVAKDGLSFDACLAVGVTASLTCNQPKKMADQ